MQVLVHTDNNLEGRDELTRASQDIVAATLDRFGDRLTRVEVHLSDENGAKSRGDDKRCLMEARPAGRQPVAVSHIGGTVAQAVTGAAEKLERLLDSTFAKLDDHKGRTSFGGDQTI